MTETERTKFPSKKDRNSCSRLESWNSLLVRHWGGASEVLRLPPDQNSGFWQIKNPHDFRDQLGGMKIPSSSFLVDSRPNCWFIHLQRFMMWCDGWCFEAMFGNVCQTGGPFVSEVTVVMQNLEIFWHFDILRETIFVGKIWQPRPLLDPLPDPFSYKMLLQNWNQKKKKNRNNVLYGNADTICSK